jgi:hypothetical protein
MKRDKRRVLYRVELKRRVGAGKEGRKRGFGGGNVPEMGRNVPECTGMNRKQEKTE